MCSSSRPRRASSSEAGMPVRTCTRVTLAAEPRVKGHEARVPLVVVADPGGLRVDPTSNPDTTGDGVGRIREDPLPYASEHRSAERSASAGLGELERHDKPRPPISQPQHPTHTPHPPPPPPR